MHYSHCVTTIGSLLNNLFELLLTKTYRPRNTQSVLVFLLYWEPLVGVSCWLVSICRMLALSALKRLVGLLLIVLHSSEWWTWFLKWWFDGILPVLGSAARISGGWCACQINRSSFLSRNLFGQNMDPSGRCSRLLRCAHQINGLQQTEPPSTLILMEEFALMGAIAGIFLVILCLKMEYSNSSFQCRGPDNFWNITHI